MSINYDDAIGFGIFTALLAGVFFSMFLVSNGLGNPFIVMPLTVIACFIVGFVIGGFFVEK